MTAAELRAEAKVWRAVAERIAEHGLRATGLCAELDYGYNGLAAFSAAHSRLVEHRQGSTTRWLGDEERGYHCAGCSSTDEAAQSRLMFALLLAEVCEDEARQAAARISRSTSAQTRDAEASPNTENA